MKAFGSIRYTDPEYLNDKKHIRDEKSDIYSVGMLFWEISSGQIPFKSCSNDFKVGLLVIGGKRESLIEGTPLKYSEIYEGKQIYYYQIILIIIFIILFLINNLFIFLSLIPQINF